MTVQKIDPNKYLLENIEHEKDISRLGLRHYFETNKDPINVAARIKIVIDKINSQLQVKMKQIDAFSLNKIVYKCFAKKNLITLHCKFIRSTPNVNDIDSTQLDIGIKQYLRTSKDNDSSDDKNWIVVFTRLKGSIYHFESVLGDILPYQLQSEY